MKNRILRSIWFWWFFTTLLGFILVLTVRYFEFHEFEIKSALTDDIATQIYRFLNYFTFFVGLFVAFVPASFKWFFPPLLSPLSLISLVFFVAIMIYSDKKLEQKNISLGRRIFLNLLILFFLAISINSYLLNILPHFSK